jgi:hypothetical protein
MTNDERRTVARIESARFDGYIAKSIAARAFLEQVATLCARARC